MGKLSLHYYYYYYVVIIIIIIIIIIMTGFFVFLLIFGANWMQEINKHNQAEVSWIEVPWIIIKRMNIIREKKQSLEQQRL